MCKRKQASPALVIECFGLPGSGKTTVINRVYNYYKNTECAVDNREDISGWLARLSKTQKIFFVFKHLRWVIGGMYYWVFKNYASLLNCFLIRSLPNFLIKPLYLNIFLSKSKPSVCLLEQWGIQYIWSALVEQKIPSQIWLTYQLRHMEKLNVNKYIYFQISPKEAALRIFNRTDGHSRFDGLSKAEIEKKLVKEYKTMSALLNAVKQNQPDLLILDASEPAEKNTILITIWLRQFLYKQQ